MARNSAGTFLMHKAAESSNWEKLVDVTTSPATGGEPEMIDITTLSDHTERKTDGIRKMETMTWEALYNPTDFAKLVALQGKEEDYAIWYGGTESGDTITPTGDYGCWSFKGKLNVYASEVSTNSPYGMTITIANTTAPQFAASPNA